MTVCDFLGIAQENILGKGCSFLISQITGYTDKDEIGELEDKGMSPFLRLKDKIAKIQMSPDIPATPAADALVANPTQPQQTDNSVGQVLEQERFQKRIEALQLALQLSLQSQQHGGREQAQAYNQSTPQYHIPTQGPAQLSVVNPWDSEFKISGQIGEPGQKDKLTFSSLAHQIETGLNKKVPEYERVHAIIKAIAPGMQLHSYLEGKTDLTLPVLWRIL